MLSSTWLVPIHKYSLKMLLGIKENPISKHSPGFADFSVIIFSSGSRVWYVKCRAAQPAPCYNSETVYCDYILRLPIYSSKLAGIKLFGIFRLNKAENSVNSVEVIPICIQWCPPTHTQTHYHIASLLFPPSHQVPPSNHLPPPPLPLSSKPSKCLNFTTK